jgi:hypothetical protein
VDVDVSLGVVCFEEYLGFATHRKRVICSNTTPVATISAAINKHLQGGRQS